jgi:hypothetical protein
MHFMFGAGWADVGHVVVGEEVADALLAGATVFLRDAVAGGGLVDPEDLGDLPVGETGDVEVASETSVTRYSGR